MASESRVVLEDRCGDFREQGWCGRQMWGTSESLVRVEDRCGDFREQGWCGRHICRLQRAGLGWKTDGGLQRTGLAWKTDRGIRELGEMKVGCDISVRLIALDLAESRGEMVISDWTTVIFTNLVWSTVENEEEALLEDTTLRYTRKVQSHLQNKQNHIHIKQVQLKHLLLFCKERGPDRGHSYTLCEDFKSISICSKMYKLLFSYLIELHIGMLRAKGLDVSKHRGNSAAKFILFDFSIGSSGDD
ncbi:hypothetical protein MAR_033351 [Mya arenaria]|uniref:Uncharacterized protein n=1 Tax=Mya arenaria TaxID=6604 RepID=A0ABY7GB47_MYAAR|nr:hypothetical protein MAR_033351 [Mya arenaria]